MLRCVAYGKVKLAFLWKSLTVTGSLIFFSDFKESKGPIQF